MNEEVIEIVIKPDGTATVEVKSGPGGSRCVEATKFLEEALGTVEKRSLKGEFYQAQERKVRVQESE